MTPDERAKNARILYENCNRYNTINQRSFENIVASAIRQAQADTARQAVEWVKTHLASALATHLQSVPEAALRGEEETK